MELDVTTLPDAVCRAIEAERLTGIRVYDEPVHGAIYGHGQEPAFYVYCEGALGPCVGRGRLMIVSPTCEGIC